MSRVRWTRAAAWCLAGGLAGRHAVGLWHLHRTLRYLRVGSALAGVGSTAPVDGAGPLPERRVPCLHVVLPVLAEQGHVEAALEWFASLLDRSPVATITIVTTAREERERDALVRVLVNGWPSSAGHQLVQFGEDQVRALRQVRVSAGGQRAAVAAVRTALASVPLTAQVVDECLAGSRYRDLPIRRVHYGGNGRKAAQVNFAVSTLDAELSDYVVVYDVDSRPTREQIEDTVRFMAARAHLDAEPVSVVQQPARFVTAGVSTRWWERELCHGAALLQTLWTLRREVPAVRRSTTAIRRGNGRAAVDAVRRALGITVGHGLLVRRDVYAAAGGLPEYTTLDDLPFGYRLTVMGVPVDVAPVLAAVPAPETVAELVATHRRWFGSYLEYPRCAAVARVDRCGTPVGRTVALVTGGYRGLTWLVTSPVTAAALVLVVAPKVRPALRLLAAGGLGVGVVAPAWVLAGFEGRPSTVRGVAADSGRLLLGYLVKSAGPVETLARAATAAALGARRDETFSPKTHRRTAPSRRGDVS